MFASRRSNNMCLVVLDVPVEDQAYLMLEVPRRDKVDPHHFWTTLEHHEQCSCQADVSGLAEELP